MKSARFANLILIGSTSLFGVIVFHTAWNYAIYPQKMDAFLYYYAFPVICIMILIASLKLPESYKVNLSIVIISTLVNVYAVDAFLFLYTTRYKNKAGADSLSWQQKRIIAAKKNGIVIDTRTRLEVVKQLRSEGINAYPTIPPSDYIFKVRSRAAIDDEIIVPFGGLSNKLTVGSNESGKFCIYESDENGFNNPKGIWSTGALDVAVVGDSFPHGSTVSQGKDVSSFIRSYYKNTLNLGAIGNGPLVELATIKEYLKPFKPKVVLWLYYEGNDLIDLDREKKDVLLIKYLESNFRQNLVLRQSEVDSALMKYVEEAMDEQETMHAEENKIKNIESLSDDVSVFTFLKLRTLRQKLGLYYEHDDIDVDMKLFCRIMISARDYVASWSGRLYFVYLPEWQIYSNSRLANKSRSKVMSLINHLDIPIIDIHEVFLGSKDPLSFFPFRLPGHYNEDGYRLMGEAILKVIENNADLQSIPYKNVPGRKTP